MKFDELLDLVGTEPVFSSAVLRAGPDRDRANRLQLSRWVKTGKLIQLRRGVYVVAAPYRKMEPHPFVLAGALRKNSYVSLQSALAYHGLIPEYVPAVTSATTARPEGLHTPFGTFLFKHLRTALFFGFRRAAVAPEQYAIVATPEKALLDLIYLTPGADSESYLRELRLQHTEVMDLDALADFARRMEKPKVQRALQTIVAFLREGREGAS